ncbi:MAG: DUF2730 family protein [Chromatiales bacterium]|nr:DUF2730 family protein [Chromatiales bacterium]
MDLDYGQFRIWFDLVQTFVMVALAIYTWIVNRTKVNKAAIDRVDNRVIRLQERVTLLENDVRHLPNHDDLGDIHEKVNTIASGMGKIEGELTALNRTLGLINDHLLNGGRK